MSGSVATGATRVVRLPSRSRRYPEGRVCSHPGCLTRLSTYNWASTCFLHSPMVAPRLRGRKSGRSEDRCGDVAGFEIRRQA
jgi:hypothetical protein